MNASRTRHDESCRLLGGGPVNVPGYVAEAVASCAMGHRDPSCRSLIRDVSDRLRAIAGVSADDFAVIPIAGSGTAANEMVLSSTVRPGDCVLVLGNGEFGYRLQGLSTYYNRTELLDFGWGGTIDLLQVEEAITRLRPSLVAVVQHETSTGLLNPIVEIGQICASHGSRLFVDTVSSMGADPINLAICNATFATTSSGKSLGAMPGVALVLARRSAMSDVVRIPRRGHYLNLSIAYESIEATGLTSNTPAVQLLAGLDAALRGIEAEGLDNRVQAIRLRTDYLRETLLAKGWELYFPDAVRSYAGTCAKLPEGMSFADFGAALLRHRFTVHAGKGPFADRMFQVCCTVGVDMALIDEFCETVTRIREEASPGGQADAIAAV